MPNMRFGPGPRTNRRAMRMWDVEVWVKKTVKVPGISRREAMETALYVYGFDAPSLPKVDAKRPSATSRKGRGL